MTRVCARCGVEKPIQRFERNGKDGRRLTECKHCRSKREPMNDRLLAYLRGLVGLDPDGPTDEDRDRWKQDEKRGATW